MTVPGTSMRAVVALVAVAVLAGCVAPGREDPAPSVTSDPTPSAVEVSTSAFDLECGDIASLIGDAGVYAAAVILTNPGDPEGLAWVYPSDTEVVAAGGLACRSTSAPFMRVSALAEATAEFTSALDAASAASEDSPIGALPHVPSDVGDGGVTTCRDTGAGGLCTWSVLVGDIWLVAELSGLALEDLVFPPDRPDGWSQQPYPVAGSRPIIAVEAIAEALASSRTEGPAPASRTSPSCVELATAQVVAEQFGVNAPDVTAGIATPSTVARSVASTAGYALPYYAAERAGWDRCYASWSTADGEYVSLTLVTRPVPVSGAPDSAPSCGVHPDGAGLLCRGAATVSGQYRVVELQGSVPAGSEAPLARVLTG
jgi:hypothetical protein